MSVLYYSFPDRYWPNYSQLKYYWPGTVMGTEARVDVYAGTRADITAGVRASVTATQRATIKARP